MALYLEAVIGAATVAAIAVAAQSRPVVRTRSTAHIGWGLIALPLPLAVLLHVAVLHTGTLDRALFVSGLGAFAVGAVLVLGRDDDGGGYPPDGPDPNWWPAFERAFRAYAHDRESRRQRVHS